MDVEQLIKDKAGIQLDIGGGSSPQLGFVNLDIRALPEVDIVHNLEETPWPLPDGCCIRAIASHIIEHINPAGFGFIRFMDEVWRILKPDGQFAISMPYGMSPGYVQDPTHCNPCNEITWGYFDPELPTKYGAGTLYNIYRPKPWKIVHLSWDVVGNMEVIMQKQPENGAEDE